MLPQFLEWEVQFMRSGNEMATRVAALKSAPAHGLCLSRVYYASDEDVPPPLIALRQQVDTWHAAAAVAGT